MQDDEQDNGQDVPEEEMTKDEREEAGLDQPEPAPTDGGTAEDPSGVPEPDTRPPEEREGEEGKDE